MAAAGAAAAAASVVGYLHSLEDIEEGVALHQGELASQQGLQSLHPCRTRMTTNVHLPLWRKLVHMWPLCRGVKRLQAI